MTATNDVTPGLAPDFAAVKSRQQNIWASGDFSVVAARIVFQAEHLCEVADLVDGRGRVREVYNLDFFKPTWVVEDVQLLLGEADGGSEKRGDRAK